MNLIERLGGYKNSKGIREAYVSNGWSVSDVCKGFHEYFTIEDLDCALLEYRRQHNIFEAGDLVIDTNYKDLDIQEIKSVNGNKIEVFHKNKAYYFATYIFSFRHATDAEIAAGRRL